MIRSYFATLCCCLFCWLRNLGNWGCIWYSPWVFIFTTPLTGRPLCAPVAKVPTLAPHNLRHSVTTFLSIKQCVHHTLGLAGRTGWIYFSFSTTLAIWCCSPSMDGSCTDAPPLNSCRYPTISSISIACSSASLRVSIFCWVKGVLFNAMSALMNHSH